MLDMRMMTDTGRNKQTSPDCDNRSSIGVELSPTVADAFVRSVPLK